MRNPPQLEQRVTVNKAVEAYYSGARSNNPVCIIHPGEVGIVKATRVPSVRRENVEFVCVDFEKPGLFQGDPKFNNTTWRIGVEHKFLEPAD